MTAQQGACSVPVAHYKCISRPTAVAFTLDTTVYLEIEGKRSVLLCSLIDALHTRRV